MATLIHISHAVHKLSRLWLRELDNLLQKAGHNLTTQQYFTLLAIRNNSPVGTLKLADILSAERTTVTRGLVTLCEHKMAKITINDGDRRCTEVSILEDGIKALDAAEELVNKFELSNCKLWEKAGHSPLSLLHSAEIAISLIKQRDKKERKDV